MPRFLTKIATPQKLREQSKRQRASLNQRWRDPFPEVHGTLPEKMVYAELSRRGIPFLFLNDVTINIPDLDFLKDYQADFVLPAQKLIIEVQGAFWHTKPKTIESDAYKFALYETVGYKVLAWWDFDIVARLPDLFQAEPLLVQATTYPQFFRSSELPVTKRTKVDTSKGIRTLNSRRKRGQQPTVSRRKIRKARSSYGSATR